MKDSRNSILEKKRKILFLLFLIFFIFSSFSFAQNLPYGEGKIYVCPLATKMEGINPRCECRIDLKLFEIVTSTCVFDGKEYEMFLTISEYEGKEYYQILGFENGGAGINFPPKAKLIKDYFKEEINKEIVFDASLSFDQNDDPLEFFFDFGDGNSTTTKNPIISHSYKKEGQYDLKLTVSDGMEEDTILAKVDILSSFPSFFSGGSSNRSFLTSPSPTPFNQSPSVPFLLDFEKKEKYLKEEKKEEEILQNEDFSLESKESIVNETSKSPETHEISFSKENQREIKNLEFFFFEKLPFAGFFPFSFSKIIFVFFIFALIFVIILKSRKTK